MKRGGLSSLDAELETIVNPQFSQLFELKLAEKIQLVEDLWDNIASSSEAVPVANWQKEELARRKATYEENPDSGISWEDAKERIRRRDG